MKIELFESYLKLIASGQKASAKIYVDDFISSFESNEERSAWSKGYLESGRYGHKIRHEIYEHLIFPVLLEGYTKSDPWSLKWLGKTAQNLYSAKMLWEKIGCKHERDLLKEAYEIDPKDEKTGDFLLESTMNGLRYAFHEWPSGILMTPKYPYDPNHEANEAIKEIEFARRLDKFRKYDDLLSEWDQHCKEVLKGTKDL